MSNEAVKALMSEVAKAGGGGLGPAVTEDIEAAESLGFPKVLVDFYRECSPVDSSGMVELNQRIWSVQNAIAENKDYVPGCYLFPLRYVVFASNKSGDAYCIDTVHDDSSGQNREMPPAKPCLGSFSEETRKALARNEDRAQWKMHPCAICGQSLSLALR